MRPITYKFLLLIFTICITIVKFFAQAIRDVFASRRWGMTTQGSTSIVDFSRQMQGRMTNLTYPYRFGKTDFGFKKTKKQDEQGGRQDEESF